MEAVIHPRSNRKSPREYDEELYKERNIVERFINKIKNYRKIASEGQSHLNKCGDMR